MGFDLGILVWAAGIVAVLMLVMRWVFAPSRPRTGRPDSGPQADLGLLTPVLSQRAPGAGAGGEEPAVRTRPALLGLPAGPRQLRPAGLRPGRRPRPRAAGRRPDAGPALADATGQRVPAGLRLLRPAGGRDRHRVGAGGAVPGLPGARIPTGCCSSTPEWAADPEVDEWYRPRAHRRARGAGRPGRRGSADIDLVANCHLHFDHCGGNALFDGTPIYVQSAGTRHRPHPSRTTRLPELIDTPGAVYRERDRRRRAAARGLRVADARHTAGHQSLVVGKPDGTVVVAGQSHDNASGFAADLLALRAGRDGHPPPLPAVPGLGGTDRAAGAGRGGLRPRPLQLASRLNQALRPRSPRP